MANTIAKHNASTRATNTSTPTTSAKIDPQKVVMIPLATKTVSLTADCKFAIFGHLSKADTFQYHPLKKIQSQRMCAVFEKEESW